MSIIKTNNKIGFINKDGVIIIEPKFNDALNFKNGIAAVKVNNKWGFIDKNGDWLIEPQFYGTTYNYDY